MPSTPLQQIADILPGYPFRGSVKPSAVGDAWAIQVRHVSSQEWLSIEPGGPTLDRVTLKGRRKPDYLLPGDVLFLAKGANNAAVLVEQVPEGTVCTPHFFLIRLKPGMHKKVLPGFLAWQLNYGEARAAIAAGRQGSLQPSVRKTELAQVPVTVPPLARQQALVKLHRAAQREAEILQAIIDNRRRQVNAIGQAILQQ